MSALSILYVLHGFPPETWAGTEIYTLELAREMQRRGHRCTILARTAGEREPGRDAPDFAIVEDRFEDLRVLRMVNRLDYADLRETYDEPRAVRAFREVLLRERPDLVHFQHLLHLSAGLVRQARDFNLPTVLHCHDYWALCPRVQLIRPDGVRCESGRGAGCFPCVREESLGSIETLEQRWRSAPEELAAFAQRASDGDESDPPVDAPGLTTWDGFGDLLDREDVVTKAFADADLLVSPSRFLRERLLASGRFDPERFLFSDNGLVTERIRALEKEPDENGRLRLGFVGSLVWYKGVDVLIEALRELDPAKVVLHVHGAFEPESDDYHARLAKLAEGAPVVFHGRFDNDRISEVYKGLDVLVVPSVWFENSPITIHEAFLARTPVVASDLGGMAEYVRDGVDGLRFRAGDSADLARVLGRLIDEGGLLAELSRDWIEIKSVKDDAADTEERYRTLLAAPRERRPLLYYDLEGQELLEQRGAVEPQGPDLVLLRPDGSVTYDLELAGGGPRIVEIEVHALRTEPDLVLSGRARLAGRTIGRIGPFTSGGEDRVFTARLRASFPSGTAGPARLTLEAGRGLRRAAHLRVGRVRVVEDLEPPSRFSAARFRQAWKSWRGRNAD